MLHLIIKTKKLIPVALIAAILSLMVCLTPTAVQAQVFISVRIGPPALPVYVQPACPTPGYLWTPGYWAYGPMGYYWVPGVWVAPPMVGVLWTPGYWGFAGGIYAWHGGYWGPHVGFYGGVNYGFGYGGFGFVGGGWAGGTFRYNTAVTNVNTTVVRNVYLDRTVINNTTIVNRASFNGPGGVMAQPSPQERAWANERHFQPTSNQLAHQQNAAQDRGQWASSNHGHPSVASMDTVNGRRFSPEARMAEQQRVNQQVHSDRQANGGHPTHTEHQQINREQNHASKKISEGRHPNKEERH
jgi:hypothetical protein